MNPLWHAIFWACAPVVLAAGIALVVFFPIDGPRSARPMTHGRSRLTTAARNAARPGST